MDSQGSCGLRLCPSPAHIPLAGSLGLRPGLGDAQAALIPTSCLSPSQGPRLHTPSPPLLYKQEPPVLSGLQLTLEGSRRVCKEQGQRSVQPRIRILLVQGRMFLGPIANLQFDISPGSECIITPTWGRGEPVLEGGLL